MRCLPSLPPSPLRLSEVFFRPDVLPSQRRTTDDDPARERIKPQKSSPNVLGPPTERSQDRDVLPRPRARRRGQDLTHETSPFLRERAFRWPSPTLSLRTTSSRLLSGARDARVRAKGGVSGAPGETIAARPLRARAAARAVRQHCWRGGQFLCGSRQRRFDLSATPISSAMSRSSWGTDLFERSRAGLGSRQDERTLDRGD